MTKLLVLVMVVAVVSVVASVKEWKNFENGKVYSHKTPISNKPDKVHTTSKGPVIQERLLHSHHRDKVHHQLKTNRLKSADPNKPLIRNVEGRHHRKSVEEEMHLKPLNERHHKFPNPALLTNDIDGVKSPDPQITKQKYLKQVKKRARLNNRHALRSRRYKRNKIDHNIQSLQKDVFTTNAPYINMKFEDDVFESKDAGKKSEVNQHESELSESSIKNVPSKIMSYW